jgi:two-component sensor histidine kinase
MVALFIVILLLPSLLIAALAIQGYRQQSEQARLQVGRYASLAAAFEQQRLIGVRQTLQSLAVLLADLPAAQCSTRLVAAVSPYPELSDVLFVEAQGGVVCATDRDAVGGSVAARPWFHQVSASRGFIVSDAFGAHPAGAIGAILAIEGGTGFSGAIASAIKLDGSLVGSRLGMPSGSFVEFLDGAGAPIIASSSAGLPDRDMLRRAVGANAAGFEAPDADGRWRVYAIAALAGTDLRMLVGIPAAAHTHGMVGDLVVRIANLVLLWALVLVAAWIGIDRLILKWIRRLNRAAQAVTRGEPVSLNLDRAPVELRRLGGTLGAMAARVDAREAELRGAAARQEWLVRETHHRVKNNLQIVASLVNLRSKALRSADAREAFADIQMPIRALALVHRHLYASDERRDIDIKPVIAELCHLFRDGSDAGPAPVSLASDLDEAYLSADRAVAVILLATEALTSAVHHLRLGSGRPGLVSVRLSRDADRHAVLEIMDDTPAPAGDAGPPAPADRLRLSLMLGLARQVGGTLTQNGLPGSGVSLRFRLDAAASPG